MNPTETRRHHSFTDSWLVAADNALRTLSGAHKARRDMPQAASSPSALTESEQRLSASLMRVNDVGEVCAQALYRSQLLATRDPSLREHFEHAAQEEIDHLAWTRQRLRELDARPSVLNPLWYAGAFAIGLVAGRIGDRVSLGFVVETEKQVEEHLAEHLDRLPASDLASRAVVAQMKVDEAEHAEAARQAGAAELPAPVQWLMRAAAKVMTTTAHHV